MTSKLDRARLKTCLGDQGPSDIGRQFADYDDVLDAVGDGVLVQDREGTVMIVNAAAAELFGVPLGKLRGTNLAGVAWHATDLDGKPLDLTNRPGRRCIRTGLPSFGHVLGVTMSDGSIQWIEMDVRPLIRDGSNEPYAVVSTVRNVTARVAAERHLAAAARRRDLVMLKSADGYRILDAEGSVIEAYSPIQAAMDPGSDFIPFNDLPAADRRVMVAMFADVRRTAGATRSSDLLIETSAGARWFEFSMTNYLDTPEVNGIVFNFRDVTGRKAAERAVTFQARLLDAAGQAIIATDARGRIVFWNQTAVRMYGWTEAEAVGQFIADVVQPVDSTTAADNLNERVASGHSWTGDFGVRRRDGTAFPVIVTSTPVFDDDGTFLAVVGVSTDITERKIAEDELAFRATHDDLTGLPNKVFLIERLEALLVESRRTRTNLDVLFIDIDRFKVINDGIGHVVGDQVLHAVSRRLVVHFPDAFIARFGGDEFVIAQPRFRHDQPNAAADCVLDAFQAPFVVNGYDLHLSASIGIVHASQSDTSETLLRDADAAMYQAKANGRGQSHVFDRGLGQRAKSRLHLEGALRHAIDRDEFEVYYQPILALPDLTVAGFEALIRWNHPERGVVGPDEFIPLAEETGLIIPIGEWVLDRAVHQLGTWQHEFVLDNAGMAVNIATGQILTKSLNRAIEAALRDAHVSATKLTLEITETSVMGDIERSIRHLRTLRNIGVHLAIDDFGTGYSSLAYLKRLPVDVLKIDRSFVADLGADVEDRPLVEAITVLGKTLDLRIVAEGVETAAQLDALNELRCPFAQGYLWSRPVPVAEMTEWLAKPTAITTPTAIDTAKR
ncbi:MAG: diguanylate cyclase domain [Ilumatobacteraceae bacterium]|nr:diguanylate cyclase domain [Ilumatobacteraceae bacterium]